MRCRLALNSPADIQASCDLIERAVELHPELVEVRSFSVVCFLLFIDNAPVSYHFCLCAVGNSADFQVGCSVLFRAEAEAHEVKLKTITKKPPAKLPSPTDFTDGDDNIDDDEDDIFER